MSTPSESAIQACAAYVNQVAPEKLVTFEQRRAVSDAWMRGYEARALNAMTTGAPLLAWAAGQRFPGATPFVAPDACASVPKAGRSRPCGDCKPGKLCPVHRRQRSLFEEESHA